MKLKISILLILIPLILCCGACTDNPTRSSITSAGLFLDPDGKHPTDRYEAEDIFYCIVTLEQPLPDTVIQISWVAADTDRAAPDYVIKIEEIVPSSSTIVFQLRNEGNFWPIGKYNAYLYQDKVEVMVLEFEVFWEIYSN